MLDRRIALTPLRKLWIATRAAWRDVPSRRHRRRLGRLRGGGRAGAARGHRVELHEAAATLGGRARRVIRDGLPLDNGQHLLLGAYADTLALARILRADEAHPPWTSGAARDASARERPARRALAARAPRCPRRSACSSACSRAVGLTFGTSARATIRWFAGQRRRGFRCSDARHRRDAARRTAGARARRAYGDRCASPRSTRRQTRASAQVFSNVLRETFGGRRTRDRHDPAAHRSRPMPCRNAPPAGSAARGHAVHTSARVRIQDVGAAGVSLAIGRQRLACATPSSLPSARISWPTRSIPPCVSVEQPGRRRHSRHRALRPTSRSRPCISAMRRHPVARRPAAARRRARPVAFRPRARFSRAHRRQPPGPLLGSLLSVVISAHGAHEALAHPALVSAIDAQLRSLARDLPALRWSQVIEEKRATYACVPGLVRPACGRLTDARTSQAITRTPHFPRRSKPPCAAASPPPVHSLTTSRLDLSTQAAARDFAGVPRPRSRRCCSRFHSRSLIVARLSCCFLPLASPIVNLDAAVLVMKVDRRQRVARALDLADRAG